MRAAKVEASSAGEYWSVREEERRRRRRRERKRREKGEMWVLENRSNWRKMEFGLMGEAIALDDQ